MVYDYEGYEIKIPDGVSKAAEDIMLEDSKNSIRLYKASVDVCKKYGLKSKDEVRNFLTDAMVLKNTVEKGIIRFDR